MTRLALPIPRPATLAIGLLVAALPARAADPRSGGDAAGGGILHELNRALVGLAERVSPAVVQVQAMGFRPTEGPGRVEGAFVARQHLIGSGLVVDPAGYVLTNAHVVHGAQRIQVLVPLARGVRSGDDDAARVFTARLIGEEAGVDLALLKIEAGPLSALPLDGTATVRQGELVFAVGSPEGLARTVTMGIVGASARQVDTAQRMAYIQTDAPINPGNSGGPLVNVDGQVVGINTFILSESGGNQGLGFAIPAPMARLVYDGLRRDGRVRLAEAGIGAQTITPTLAAALGLPRDWGVFVADAALGSAARAAGLRQGDVLIAVDGRPIDNLAALTTARYLHPAGTPIEVTVLRGPQRLTVRVDAKEKAPALDLADLASPDTSLVRRLGILGIDVGPRLVGVIPPLLEGSGVVVAARTLDAVAVDSGLQKGDVIHSLNRTRIDSMETLRQALRTIQAGDPVAIEVERQGKLLFLSFAME